MNRTLVVLGVIAVAVALIAVGMMAGVALAQGQWGNWIVGRGMMGGAWGSTQCVGASQGYGMMGGASGGARCLGAQQGYGMMGGASGSTQCLGAQQGYGMMGSGMMGAGLAGTCSGYAAPGQGKITTLQEVQSAVEQYVQDLGYTNLKVTEVMEFERNYYAIVAEKDTGTGAMELLVDKATGAVGPEMGPNMMWNAKYGMMGRSGMMGNGGMMGGYSTGTGEMTLSADQAAQAAQRWLDANLPGRTAGQGDAFYGYYTFHFLKDGKIDGMLSVNGSSGDVWYHNWHGGFITGTE